MAVGIGVESGFIEVTPVTFTLYNFDVCALFDGQAYYLGISPGFEYPRRLVRNIFLHRQPFQQARQYITTTADVEQQAGLVGVLAGGLIDRPEMTRLATRLALIRYLRRHDYDALGLRRCRCDASGRRPCPCTGRMLGGILAFLAGFVLAA